MKRTGQWLSALFICLVLAVLPMRAEAADVASGTCGADGDNLKWTLSDAGVLTISGTGDMADYSYYDSTPWREYRSTVKSVVLKSGVTSIGDYAFSFFTNSEFRKITIPEGVTRIGIEAFSYCSFLGGNPTPNVTTNSIVLPDSVTIIEKNAFKHSAIDRITLGAGVETIEAGAFAGCSSFENFIVDKDNKNFSAVDGILCSKDQKTMLQYPSGREDETITIPACVESIGNSSISSNYARNIVFHDGLKYIGDYAFSAFSRLESVTIPDSVVYIGFGAFASCTKLEKVVIGDGVQTIDASAFSGCSALTSVTIGSSLETIGVRTFSNCTSLGVINLPVSLESVGTFAFNGCTALATVYYEGSEEDWGKISFGGSSAPFLNAEIIYDYAGANALPAPTVTLSKNSSGKIYLTWTAVAGAATYEVWYSTDGTNFNKLTTSSGRSLTHSSAKDDVSYYYKVRGVNGTTNGMFSGVKAAMSLPAPVLEIKKDVKGVRYLSWTAVDDADEYEIWYSTNGTAFSLLDTTDSTKLLQINANYFYKVRAISEVRTGSFSNVASVSGVVTLTTPTLTVTLNSSGKPYLSWTGVTGATKYEVYSSTNGTEFTKLITTGGTTVTHSSAQTGTTYHYKVRAINAITSGAFSSTKNIFVAASLAAPDLTVTLSSSGKPYLIWTAVGGATKYEVWYSTDGENFSKLITTTGKVLTHSNAQTGTTYYYKVRAINASTSGAFSIEIDFTITGLGVPVLKVTTNASGKPYLTWSGIIGATKYEVHYSTDGTYFQKLITTAGRTLTHSSAKAGMTYYYSVRALNSTTKGDYSSSQKITVASALTAPTVTVTTNASGKPYLSWTGVTGATKYEVWYSTDGEDFTKLIATTGKVLTHSSAKAGTTYYYKVRAINATTNGTFSAVKSAVMPLAAPTLTVTKNSSGKPYLTWTGVTGATKYEVYFSADGETFTKLITTTGKVLTHSSAKVGNTYYYKVCAINATTNGAFSAIKNISVN